MQHTHPSKWVELEVLFGDSVWYRGRLMGRVAGTQQPDSAWYHGKPVERVAAAPPAWQPPWWTVQFDDGELRHDIWLANPKAPVRFDAGAYGSTVEVRVAKEWRRGRLVQLNIEGDVWAVAFDDGGWAEDMCIGHPDVWYVFAGTAEGTRR